MLHSAPRSPCTKQVNTAVETVDFEQVWQCFVPSATNWTTATVAPCDLTKEDADAMTQSDQLELVLRLMTALLPQI